MRPSQRLSDLLPCRDDIASVPLRNRAEPIDPGGQDGDLGGVGRYQAESLAVIRLHDATGQVGQLARRGVIGQEGADHFSELGGCLPRLEGQGEPRLEGGAESGE